MGIIKEFKDFIVKGNAIDLAVGIIIGAAFGAVVTSLVKDVIMPPIGAAMGGVDFADYKYTLVDPIEPAAVGEPPVYHPLTKLEVKKPIPAVTLNYGAFINACIALVIQGFAVFMIVKVINNMKRKEEAKPVEVAALPQDVVLLTEIRDLLAKP